MIALLALALVASAKVVFADAGILACDPSKRLIAQRHGPAVPHCG